MPSSQMFNRDQNAGSSFPPSGGGGAAMILAAGLGSRLKPWTDHHPKALAVVNNKSLLQRNVEYLQQHGIYNVIINVHHFADQIVSAIKNNNGWGSNIVISDEMAEVLETGGGLMKAASYLNTGNPFVLMNVDILTDLDLGKMIAFHNKHMPLATLATTSRQTSRYFLFDDEDNLCGWRKTSPPTPLHAVERGERIHQFVEDRGDPQRLKENVKQKAFSGIHIIDPEIFSLIKQKGKFSMVDVYLNLMNDYVIKSFDHSESRFIDVGKPESIALAEKMFVKSIGL